jgi:hypothetical protein
MQIQNTVLVLVLVLVTCGDYWEASQPLRNLALGPKERRSGVVVASQAVVEHHMLPANIILSN